MKRLSAVISNEEYVRIEKLAKTIHMTSVAELVRRAVRSYAEEAGVAKLVTFREVSTAQARREITDYLKKKAGIVWPDEMAEELGIDYRLVLQVVKDLTQEGKLEVVENKVEAVVR